MSLPSVKVRVVEYMGLIIIEPLSLEAGLEDYWHPTKKGRFGCVLTDTKSHLGVSEEALKLMRTIKVGRDDIGDISWWWCTNETYAFSWWGPIYRVIDPTTAVSDRGFREFRSQCTIIPNTLSNEAAQRVDTRGSEMWKEPFSLDVELED